jgi:hypothetical protein
MASWFDSIRRSPLSYRAMANAHIDWLISPAGVDEVGLVVERTFDTVLERPPSPSQRETWIARIREDDLVSTKL